MKKNGIVRKAANSFVGRILRRLLGEEKGAVMMEYIVIGLLIAAVAVVAVGAFGNAATGLFAVLTNAMRGAPTDATSKLTQVDTDYNSDSGTSEVHRGRVLNDGNWSKTQETVSVIR